jgi:hypothetical protein
MRAAVCAALLSCAHSAWAADTGIRTAVAMPALETCQSPTKAADLGKTYYEDSLDALSESVRQLLNFCKISKKITTRYAVILFAAKQTPAAEGKPVIVHLLFDATKGAVLNRSTMLGVSAATWIFVTDDPSDRAVIQLVTTPGQNPIFGQLGKLVSTVVPKIGGEKGDASSGKQLFAIGISVSDATALPSKRGTIAETDYVSSGKTQVDGTATFDNQPLTWLTVNAGAGFFAGKPTGATRAKIDSKTYVSDPLARAATYAGVTFHAPFDASLPSPSFAERCGVVLSAVLTPAAGVYVGPTCGWRGLSFTVGWAEMWINVPPGSKQINDPVEGQEKLATGRTGRLLISATYAFGG